jgi:GDP-D-mannose dehydratase
LEGAKETLKVYKPFVIIEVSPKLLSKYSLSDSTYIYSYFKELDYMIFKISKLNIVKIKPKDLNTDKSYNWLCIPKGNSKLIKKIKFEVSPRRAGDLPAFWANANKANQQLNWQARKTLEQMMADTWRWQSNNPNGYFD